MVIRSCVRVLSAVLVVMLCSGLARAEQWTLEYGGGLLVLDPPWSGMSDQQLTLPYISAEYGRWRLGPQYGLFQYRVSPAGWPVDLSMGLGYRDETYDSIFYLDDKESDDPVFDGYDSPSGELVARTDISWGGLSIQLRQDISNQSRGASASALYLHPVYLDASGLQVLLGGGARWKSARYTDYLYGIHGDNVDPGRARTPYRPGSTVNYLMAARVIYPFNRRWALSGTVRYARLDSAIEGSPLVGQRLTGQFMVLVTYRPDGF